MVWYHIVSYRYHFVSIGIVLYRKKNKRYTSLVSMISNWFLFVHLVKMLYIHVWPRYSKQGDGLSIHLV